MIKAKRNNGLLQGRTAGAPALQVFSQGLPIALMRARESTMERIRPVLRGYGVTEQQWRVLRTLAEIASEVEVTQLADLVFLAPPSLSRILRELLKRGLILRRSVESDLRRSLVSISPAGLALIERATPAVAHVTAEIDQAFGDTRMRALRTLLSEFETALRRPGDGRRAERDEDG